MNENAFDWTENVLGMMSEKERERRYKCKRTMKARERISRMENF